MDNLIGYAYALMPNFRKIIEDEKDLEAFFEDRQILKVILFNAAPDTPQDFKGLTSYFRNRIDFAEIFANNSLLCEKYGVTEFPHVLLLKYDESAGDFAEVTYNGAKRFESLRAFLHKHALKQKKRKWKSEFEEEISASATQALISDLPKMLSKSDQWVALHLVKKSGKQHR